MSRKWSKVSGEDVVRADTSPVRAVQFFFCVWVQPCGTNDVQLITYLSHVYLQHLVGVRRF